ncbi:hypothetical protein QR98_0051780 [Sarcoptes scabiei]|uniref:Uncharacterized protein n=1 Tax=Sarcoptes scabiei TaxID=52283 RepID=A0A132A8G2_SARSC|nr:hypothetical protein QR98_0051780 [Sarcoptes scabiei]
MLMTTINSINSITITITIAINNNNVV